MRVLHVIASLAPGSGPSNLLGLARALVRQGCEVSVFSTDIDEWGRLLPWQEPRRLLVPTDRPLIDQGATVRYFRVNWPSRYQCSWPMAAALRREIKTFDIVHIHSLYLFHGLVAAHYCRQYGVPYIIRPHGTLDAWHRRRHRRLKALYTWLVEGRNISGAAALHYTSMSEAKHARAAGVAAPGLVVGLGVDLAEYRDLPDRGTFRAKYPDLGNRRLVVFLGRITPKKGLDLLIPAVARVASAVPNVHLVLAGPDSEGYASVVKTLIRQNRMEHRVTWTGMLTGRNKLELLRDADVWTLPSHDENFAVAVVEAMAAGAPVIITDRVGIHDAISQADAGLVVKPTVEAVAEALEALLTNDEQRLRLAANAAQLALSEFTWDVAASRLVRQYEAIVQGNRGPADHLPEAVHVY